MMATTEYTEAIGLMICERLATGEPLSKMSQPYCLEKFAEQLTVLIERMTQMIEINGIVPAEQAPLLLQGMRDLRDSTGVDERLPSIATIYRWLASNNGFLKMYEIARQDQANTLADEIITIADETPKFEIDDVRLTFKVDNAAVQAQRLRVEARKWVAAKLLPKKYGDHLTAEVTTPPGVYSPIDNLELARRIAFMLLQVDVALTEREQANTLALEHLPDEPDAKIYAWPQYEKDLPH